MISEVPFKWKAGYLPSEGIEMLFYSGFVGPKWNSNMRSVQTEYFWCVLQKAQYDKAKAMKEMKEDEKINTFTFPKKLY